MASKDSNNIRNKINGYLQSLPSICKFYSCTQCSYKTRLSSCFCRHQKRHAEKKAYVCQECACSYSNSAALTLHLRRVHHIGKKRIRNKEKSEIRTENCGVCSEIIEVRLMTAHRRLHHPEVKPYYCRLCPYQAVCAKSLTRHKKHHVLGSISCEKCSCAFGTPADLIRHTNSIHRSESQRTNKNRKYSMPVHMENCTLCSKGIPAHLMTSHRRLHHSEMKGYHRRECPSQTSSKSLIRYKKHHANHTPLKCPYCCASFNQHGNFVNHIRHSHSNRLFKAPSEEKQNAEIRKEECVDPVYICILCSKTFCSETELRGHLGHHTMAHSCPVCSERFPNAKELKKHLDRGHTENRFKDKPNASALRLLTTTSINVAPTGENSHSENNKQPLDVQPAEMQCPVCNVTFAGNTKLKLHLMLRHSKPKTPKCTEVGRTGPVTRSSQNLLPTALSA